MATLFDPQSTIITFAPGATGGILSPGGSSLVGGLGGAAGAVLAGTGGGAPSIIITGLFSGTFVKVQRDEDAYKKKTGANGDVARAKIRNKGGSVSITLLMTSSTNALLSAIHQLGEVIPPTGQDVGALQIQDLLGGTTCHAAVAWIKKVANVEFADDILAREWTFDCEAIDIVHGNGGTID